MLERTQLLVVGSDVEFVDLVWAKFSYQAFDLFHAAKIDDALRTISAHEPDIVLLELEGPGALGFRQVKRIRRRSSAAIIVVSEPGEPKHRVSALKAGADDYIVRPFDIEEFIARVEAVLRRGGSAPPSTTISIADVEIDLDANRVTRGGELIHLTPTEFALLREFVLNPGRLLSHQALLRRVWGLEGEEHPEYVRVYVARLRSKLASPQGPDFLITERGSGYRFFVTDQP